MNKVSILDEHICNRIVKRHKVVISADVHSITTKKTIETMRGNIKREP